MKNPLNAPGEVMTDWARQTASGTLDALVWNPLKWVLNETWNGVKTVLSLPAYLAGVPIATRVEKTRSELAGILGR